MNGPELMYITDQPVKICLVSCRLQGMRLGNRLAQLLDADKPLFGDFGSLSILREEWWHPDCAGTEFGVPTPSVPQPHGVDAHVVETEDRFEEAGGPLQRETRGRADEGRERRVEGFKPQVLGQT